MLGAPLLLRRAARCPVIGRPGAGASAPLSSSSKAGTQRAPRAAPVAVELSQQPRKLRLALPSLSQLPEATSRLTFRMIPFGASLPLMFPPTGTTSSFGSPLFSLRCFPAVRRGTNRSPSPSRSLPTPPPSLHHTTSSDPLQPFLTREAMRERQTRFKRHHKPYEMDLTIMLSKKKVHKSAVIRDRCKRRLKEAIRVVVVRGARAATARDQTTDELVFEQDQEGPRKWLVGGHSYVVSGTLELYLHPFPLLVEVVRKALTTVKTKAETRIYELALNQIPALPYEPDYQPEEDTRALKPAEQDIEQESKEAP